MKFRIFIIMFLTLVAGFATAASTWQLSSAYYVPAKMPMTVVFPRPDSDSPSSTTRQRLAYADGSTEYRIPVAIQGGAYPFHFVLSTSPAITTGMTIGQDFGKPNYGIVTWTPQASDVGKTYNVTVTVTDQGGNTVNATWSVTATLSNFVFIDPNAASGGDGTKAHPFNSTLPLFVNHNSSSASPYANDIVYFRGGTTVMQGPETDADSKAGNVQLQANKNPVSLLGYPGDTTPAPTIDFSQSEIIVDAQDDVFMGGLHFYNSRTDINNAHFVFFNQNSAQNRATFFENNFDTVNRGTLGNDNPAAVTFFNPGSMRKYFAMIGCSLNNFSASIVDAYALSYVVIENNKLNSSTSTPPGQGIFLKSDIQNASIRRNTSLLTSFNYGAIDVMLNSQIFTNDNIEVSYNLALNTDPTKPALVYSWTAGSQSNNKNPKVYVYRNTFNSWIGGLDNFAYTVWEDNNVILDDANKLTKYNSTVSGGKTVIVNGNLIGTSSNGYIDDIGNLTGSAASQYNGTRGYQIITSDVVLLNSPLLQ